MSIKDKSICAIIINYFGADKTKECLKSLADQPIDTIYLVDNSVSEKEAKNLYKIKNDLELASNNFQIKIVINKNNQGFGRTINKIIRFDIKNYAHDYYLLINNDAIAGKNMVKIMFDEIENNDDLALVAPKLINSNKEIFYFWYHKILGLLNPKNKKYCFPYLTGCCLLMHNSIIDNNKIFDEDFFMYGEDVELSWRVKQYGKQLICAQNAYLYHEGTGSSNKGDLFYEYHMARGHILLALKIYNKWFQLPIYITGRGLYLSTRSVVRSLRYKKITPIIALILNLYPKELQIRAHDK